MAVRQEQPASPLGATNFIGQSTVAAFSYFNHGCEVTSADIGRYCSIGQDVLIGPGHHFHEFLTTHPIASDPSGASAGFPSCEKFAASKLTGMKRWPNIKPRTKIGHDVWICARAIICQGVTIGNGAVIGAGAVVTKDVQPFAIVGGVPAKLIRYRFRKELRDRIEAVKWWDYDLSRLPERDFSDPDAFLDILEAAIAKGMPKLSPTVVQYGN